MLKALFNEIKSNCSSFCTIKIICVQCIVYYIMCTNKWPILYRIPAMRRQWKFNKDKKKKRDVSKENNSNSFFAFLQYNTVGWNQNHSQNITNEVNKLKGVNNISL